MSEEEKEHRWQRYTFTTLRHKDRVVGPFCKILSTSHCTKQLLNTHWRQTIYSLTLYLKGDIYNVYYKCTTIIYDSYRWWQRWYIGGLWLIFFNDWRPTQMHSFLQNVKVLNFVQPLRMYAIYIYNRTEMPKNHILTFVVWKPLFVFLLYSRFGVSRYL